jgi:glutaredoxin-related protein
LIRFSKKAKGILSKYDLNPPLRVVEVDERADADSIKTILTRLTGLGTVPNTLVHGKSLGDSGAIVTLHGRGELRDKLAGKA